MWNTHTHTSYFCGWPRIAMSTSWHINHDPLNDCLPQPTWQQQFPPPPDCSYYTFVCVCTFWSQDIRLYANISVCLFVYCLLFPIWVLHMEIGKVFIHTKRNIAYTTRWPLALRERHEIKRSRRESKHTQAHKTHTHTRTEGQCERPASWQLSFCAFVL